MATTTKQWTTGTGSVTLTYTGQGSGTITVSSDENNLYVDRSMTLTVATTGNAVTRQVTVSQGMREPNLVDKNGNWLIDSNDTYLIVQE